MQRSGYGTRRPAHWPRVRPDFAVLDLLGIGCLLPPSYLGHLVERWPGVFGPLAQAERRLDPRGRGRG